MAHRLVAMVLVPTILGFLLAFGKAFAQLQTKDKTGRLVNLRRKAKCADGLSRETLNAKLILLLLVSTDTWQTTK